MRAQPWTQGSSAAWSKGSITKEILYPGRNPIEVHNEIRNPNRNFFLKSNLKSKNPIQKYSGSYWNTRGISIYLTLITSQDLHGYVQIVYDVIANKSWCNSNYINTQWVIFTLVPDQSSVGYNGWMPMTSQSVSI